MPPSQSGWKPTSKAPILANFRAGYPDIAIRPTRNPPDTLVGRHLSNIEQAIYGQRSHWQGMQTAVRNGPELAVPLWILLHPDLRRVSRIRALTQFVADHIRHTFRTQT